MTRLSYSFKTILTFSFLIFLVGCFPPPKPTPPAFSLYGHQGLIILPFENTSTDPALGQELQDNLTAQLVGLDATPIYEQGKVSAFLNQLDEENTDPNSNPAVMSQLTKHFNGDLILTGTVESYVESTQVQPPQRVQVALFSKDNKWGFYTVQQVKVSASARLINVANGSIIWVKKAWGNGQNQVWTDINYPGDHTDPPAEGWDSYLRPHHDDHDGDRHDQDHRDRNGNTIVNINIQNPNNAPAQAPLLYQSDATFSGLRENAIGQTANWLTDDFKGHGGWYQGYVDPGPGVKSN